MTAVAHGWHLLGVWGSHPLGQIHVLYPEADKARKGRRLKQEDPRNHRVAGVLTLPELTFGLLHVPWRVAVVATPLAPHPNGRKATQYRKAHGEKAICATLAG